MPKPKPWPEADAATAATAVRIGERLTRERERQKLDLTEAARRARLERHTLMRLESGESVTLMALGRYARALKLPLRALFR